MGTGMPHTLWPVPAVVDERTHAADNRACDERVADAQVVALGQVGSDGRDAVIPLVEQTAGVDPQLDEASRRAR